MHQVREGEGEVPLSQLRDGSHFGEGALVGDNHRSTTGYTTYYTTYGTTYYLLTVLLTILLTVLLTILLTLLLAPLS